MLPQRGVRMRGGRVEAHQMLRPARVSPRASLTASGSESALSTVLGLIWLKGASEDH